MGCWCQDVLQQRRAWSVLAGWPVYPQLSHTLPDSSRWVNSCVLANVVVTQIYQDLPGAGVFQPPTAPSAAAAVRAGTAWTGNGQVKQAPALKHRPHVQKVWKHCVNTENVALSNPRSPPPPAVSVYTRVCMEMTCKSANPPRNK